MNKDIKNIYVLGIEKVNRAFMTPRPELDHRFSNYNAARFALSLGVKVFGETRWIWFRMEK